MKAFYRTLLFIAASAMAFVSCQKEIENPEIDNAPKMKTIKVSTDIATRTTLDSNHENIVWSTGDKISLFNDVDKTNTVNTEKVDSQSTSSLKIISGSFSTGSPLPQKTYITVYVGEEHAGEKCQIRVFYSHEGTRLNAGNIVDETVDNTGHFTMRTANELNYYPDYAEITLYDARGNVADSMNVNMKTTSGTQTF